jgi:hypothetical protein
MQQLSACRALPVLVPAISHALGPVHAAISLPSHTPASDQCAEQYGTIITSSGSMLHSMLTLSSIAAQISPESLVPDALSYAQPIATFQSGDSACMEGGCPCMALTADMPPMSSLFQLKLGALEKVALPGFDCNSHSLCVACAHGMLVQVTSKHVNLLSAKSAGLTDVWTPNPDQPPFTTTRISIAACALPWVAVLTGGTVALLDVSTRKNELVSTLPVCEEVSGIALLAVPESSEAVASELAAQCHSTPLQDSVTPKTEATVLAVGVHDSHTEVHLSVVSDSGSLSMHKTVVPTPSAALSFAVLPSGRAAAPATLVIGTILGVAVLAEVSVQGGNAPSVSALRHLSVGSTHVSLTAVWLPHRDPLPSAAILAVSSRVLLLQQMPSMSADVGLGVSANTHGASSATRGAGTAAVGAQVTSADNLVPKEAVEVGIVASASLPHLPSKTHFSALEGGQSSEGNPAVLKDAQEVCAVTTPNCQMHPTAACALPDGRLVWTTLGGDVLIGTLDPKLELRQTSRPLAALPRALTLCSSCNAVAASVRLACCFHSNNQITLVACK